jgi:predicted Zn-dependent protease
MVVLWSIDKHHLQIKFMTRAIIQGTATILLFFGAWFALKQIDWMAMFKVEQATDKTEQKIGELIWEFYKKNEKTIDTPYLVGAMDSIVARICKENEIDVQKIKIHILEKDEINAFALPNGHLVVYSGLILNSDNQEELTGVICHEIAHIELNHVMKKLVKEIGLSVIISMTTGNGSAEGIKKAAKMLSSSAFDRSLEKEADIKAVEYLTNAKVNPEPFANFLYKLSEKEQESAKYFTWISTHPDSRERAEYIIQYSKKNKVEYKPIVTVDTWKKVKDALKN